MWGWEAATPLVPPCGGQGLGTCVWGCGLLSGAGSCLFADRGTLGLVIAKKPSDRRRKGLSSSRASWGCRPGYSSSLHLHSGSGKLDTGVLVAALRGPHCPIMASGLIVLLLGCWLPGRSGVSGRGLHPKPNISVSPSGVIPVGGNVTIRCWYNQYGGMRFLLYKDGDGNPLSYTDPAGSEAEFPILSVSREQRGNYTCCYSDRTGDVAYSEHSDPVQIIVAGGHKRTQPGMTLAPTHPGHTSQGESGSRTSPNLTSPVIPGVSAAAAIFLLLLAFVCFRKTRARKGSAPRTSSASPLGALKVPAQQEPVYDSVNEGKEPQTSPHKPDPDGLTYAELDHQVLHAKRGAPAPEPVQPSLYAAISTSQGATH